MKLSHRLLPRDGVHCGTHRRLHCTTQLQPLPTADCTPYAHIAHHTPVLCPVAAVVTGSNVAVVSDITSAAAFHAVAKVRSRAAREIFIAAMARSELYLL